MVTARRQCVHSYIATVNGCGHNMQVVYYNKAHDSGILISMSRVTEVALQERYDDSVSLSDSQQIV